MAHGAALGCQACLGPAQCQWNHWTCKAQRRLQSGLERAEPERLQLGCKGSCPGAQIAEIFDSFVTVTDSCQGGFNMGQARGIQSSNLVIAKLGKTSPVWTKQLQVDRLACGTMPVPCSRRSATPRLSPRLGTGNSVFGILVILWFW